MCGKRTWYVGWSGRKSGVVIASRSNNSLDDLFVRYWENSLTEVQAAELEQQLSSDPQAREEFHLFCLQAVAAGELSSVSQAAREPVELESIPIKIPVGHGHADK